jgi:hypothetical protein
VAWEQDEDAWGGGLQSPYEITDILSWQSWNTSVAVIVSVGSDVAEVGGVADGFTGIQATGESNGWAEYDPSAEEDPENHVPLSLFADAQVVVPYPVDLRIHPTNQPPDAVNNGSPTHLPYVRVAYIFDSSSGNLAHLGQCEVLEDVQYSPSNWPSPPFQGNPPGGQPAFMASGTAGFFVDSHTTTGPMLKDGQGQPVAGAVTGAQTFRWRCGNIQNNALQDFTTGANKGPHNIVRDVTTSSGWRFLITKHGLSAQCPLNTSTGFCQ